MKNIKGLIAFFSLAVALSIECSGKPDSVVGAQGVQMMGGQSSWLSELGKLKSPSGILPVGTNFSGKNIRYQDPAAFKEFFVFDDNTSLILLSADPVYFIRIDSRDFKYKLSRELAQINAGVSGTMKTENSITYFKAIGDSWVEIYFTPKELYNVSSGNNRYRIGDANSTTAPDVDLWKLYDAAANASLYTPVFADQQIADDAYAAAQAGKRRLILTSSNAVSSPQVYNSTAVNLNFSAMIGTNLAITDKLLGAEDINFQDRYKLQRDFGAFFSVPLGNPKITGRDCLSRSDGIVVVIRGDMTPFKNFLSAQGVNMDATPVTPTLGTPGLDNPPTCPALNLNPNKIVINEIGSNCNGATTNNYIELYNTTSNSIDLSGWRLYRDSGCSLAGGWTSTISLSGTIAPNGYKVITGNTYAPGTSCPAADIKHSSTLPLSANDCLALTSATGAPATATDSNVVDFVGFGTASTYEGAGATAALGTGSNQCLSRTPNGNDSDNNNANFVSETTMPCSPNAANGTISVMSASATTNSTTVLVYFSATPNAAANTASNYCITLAGSGSCAAPALTVGGAVLAGNVVTLTTSAQASGTTYTVSVSGVAAAVGGGTLAKASANFSGYGPILWSATPTSATTVDLNFDSQLLNTSINGFPGRFTFDNSLTTTTALLQAGAPIPNRRITLTTPAQTAGTYYTVTVSSLVLDIGGTNGVNPDFRTAKFYGFHATYGIFEQATASLDDISLWTNVASGTLQNNASPVQEGANSMSWTDITTTCGTASRMAQSTSYYPVTPGGTYTASMYIKSGTITGTNVIGRTRMFWFKDSTGTASATANTFDTPAPPAATITVSGSPWTLYTKSFTAPADAYFMQFAIHACRTGGTATDQIYFDQVYFGP